MNELVQWGLGVVQWIQTFRNPLFDQFFLAINFLGDEEFYILFLPVLFWCFHKALGIRLGIVFFFSMYANQWLKDLFAQPRPWQVDSQLWSPIKQTGYGIPSGHAQGTTTVWGYLATQLRRPVWWALGIAIPLCVSIGRMYLADHFAQDVIAGVLIGIILVALYAVLEPRVTAWLVRQSLGMKLALAVAVPLVLAVFHLTDDTDTVVGTLLGFYLGVILEEEWIGFSANAVWWKQAAKFALGIAIALGIRFGLKAVFPALPIFDLIRYAFIGIWIGLGAPWLFVITHLSTRSKRLAPEMRAQPAAR